RSGSRARRTWDKSGRAVPSAAATPTRGSACDQCLRHDERAAVRDDSRVGLDRGAEEFRQREGVLVRLPVPVPEIAADSPRDERIHARGVEYQGIDALAAEQEPPRGPEAGHERLVAADDREDVG